MEGAILIKPIITEKSLRSAQNGLFTFEADIKTNKKQIKTAIESMFKVHVKGVNTAILKGKKRLAGRKRTPVHEPDRKKAWVQLARGEKIDLFEAGEQKK